MKILFFWLKLNLLDSFEMKQMIVKELEVENEYRLKNENRIGIIRKSIELNPDKFLVEFTHKNGSKSRYVFSKDLKISISNPFLSSRSMTLYAFCHEGLVDTRNPANSMYYSKLLIKIIPFKSLVWEKIALIIEFFIIIIFGIFLMLFVFSQLVKQQAECEEVYRREQEMKATIDELKIIAMYLKKVYLRDVEERERMLEMQRINRRNVRVDNILSGGFEALSSSKLMLEEDEEDLAAERLFRKSSLRRETRQRLFSNAIHEEEAEISEEGSEKGENTSKSLEESSKNGEISGGLLHSMILNGNRTSQIELGNVGGGMKELKKGWSLSKSGDSSSDSSDSGNDQLVRKKKQQ